VPVTSRASRVPAQIASSIREPVRASVNGRTVAGLNLHTGLTSTRSI
jgi:hypothetical protein